MSNAADFLAKHFDAKLLKEVYLSMGGHIEVWRIGPKILPLLVSAHGEATLFLPKKVADEKELKISIEDYLVDCHRVTIPMSAFKPGRVG